MQEGFVSIGSLLRVLWSYVIELWWLFVEETSEQGAPSYIHARWRQWQESELRRKFKETGDVR